MLVFHRRQLETVLSELVDHYNEHRLHPSLGQQAPLTVGKKPLRISDPDPGQLRQSDKLGPHSRVPTRGMSCSDGIFGTNR
jgi:hypothetical protein